MKKNSLDLFVKKKALKDARDAETIKYKAEGLEEAIEIEPLSENKVYEIMTNVDKDAPIMELWDRLIYEAMPELRTKEALETFNCTGNPEAIVGEIFTMGERNEIGQQLKSVVDRVDIERIKN